jgi:hypothetical protein
MYKRKLVIALGVITGFFIAASIRAQVNPPKIAELEEFRAILNNMIHIALPQGDFGYIAARKTRLASSRDRVKNVELPDSLLHREQDFKRARDYFMKISGRLLDVMASKKRSETRKRLHALDTAFSLLYVALGGPPAAVEQCTTAAAPFHGDEKNPPQIPPDEMDVAELREAVESLLATKVTGDYRVIREPFERERK